ncbi:hypothetical protein L2E82_01042 [Cichorium intybus]|uniref:Uncharacterized protein n=1 Tax=Cichorium intybus TaxID=13427 RepID=A0ACB9GY79_CICIN|nr:hypothetical protein L2E82_01042 [Cichorium intybus]
MGFHRKCNSMEMLHDNLGFAEQFDDFVGLEFIAPFLEDNAPPLEGLFDDILLPRYEDIEATNLPVWDIKGFNNEEDAWIDTLRFDEPSPVVIDVILSRAIEETSSGAKPTLIMNIKYHIISHIKSHPQMYRSKKNRDPNQESLS